MTHQQVLLRLPGRCIQGLLQVIPDHQAAQGIGALTHLAFSHRTCLRAHHQPRGLLHLVQRVEGFLSMPGVIALLADHTRVTRHSDAPCGDALSLEHLR
jgi:hypothetical protein